MRRRYRCPRCLCQATCQVTDPPPRGRSARGRGGPDVAQRVERPAGAGQAPPVDALHAHGRLRGRARCPIIERGEGCYVYDTARQALPRRALGAVLRQHRSRPRRARRSRRRAGQAARLLHQLELRPPTLDRTGGAHRRARARRPQPRVLRLRRLGGGRVGVEARQGLSRRLWGAAQAQDRLAQPGLPRHLDGGADSHRAAAAARALRAAHPGRHPRAEHQLLPLDRRPRPPVGGGRDRGGDPVRGAHTRSPR